MIFQHTWQKILSGEKTQTRRIVKDGDALSWVKQMAGYCVALPIQKPIIARDGRYLYQVGKTYAVQPARGQKAIARIRITSIKQGDVRHISHADVLSEGFSSKREFLTVWFQMHDPYMLPLADAIFASGEAMRTFRDRPAELYNAWVLGFELVKE